MSRYGPASEQFMRKHYGPLGYVNLKENKMDPLFKVHMLNDTGKQKAGVIACKFFELLEGLKGLCGDDFAKSREFSIVKTKLEEACFFAKKAMANVSDNQA